MRRVTTLLTKEQIDEDRVRGAAAVVIDVVLPATTVVTILDRGALSVYPAASPGAARILSARLGSGKALPGGEEEGLAIEGFDCGPFPAEYLEETVRGRLVIFSTTNGTRAVIQARHADPLLIACLRNAPATAAYLQRLNPDRLYLICFGSRARLALEDFRCAGLIAALLDLDDPICDDATRLAVDFVQHHLGAAVQTLRRRGGPLMEPAPVIEMLLASRIGNHLARNGLSDVLDFTGRVGASSSVVLVQGGCGRRVVDGRLTRPDAS